MALQLSPSADVDARRHNIAEIALRARSDLAGAIARQERGVAIAQRASSVNPLALSAAVNNLGNTYQRVGRVHDEVAVAERALGLRRSALGGEHPDIGAMEGNLNQPKGAPLPSWSSG